MDVKPLYVPMQRCSSTKKATPAGSSLLLLECLDLLGNGSNVLLSGDLGLCRLFQDLLNETETAYFAPSTLPQRLGTNAA